MRHLKFHGQHQKKLFKDSMVAAMAIIASLFFLLLDQILKFFLEIILKSEFLMSNWFIVQSHSSFENKVAQQIKDEADKSKVSETKFRRLLFQHMMLLK